MKRQTLKQRQIHESAVALVYNDIVDGLTTSNIINKLVNDDYSLGFNYSKSRAYKILSEARKLITEDFNDFRKSARQQIYSTLSDILTEAKDMGDRMSALKSIDMLAKLCGAYEPESVNLNNNQTITIDFKFD